MESCKLTDKITIDVLKEVSFNLKNGKIVHAKAIDECVEKLEAELEKKSEADKMLDWIDEAPYDTILEIYNSPNLSHGRYPDKEIGLTVTKFGGHQKHFIADDIRDLIKQAMEDK